MKPRYPFDVEWKASYVTQDGRVSLVPVQSPLATMFSVPPGANPYIRVFPTATLAYCMEPNLKLRAALLDPFDLSPDNLAVIGGETSTLLVPGSNGSTVYCFHSVVHRGNSALLVRGPKRSFRGNCYRVLSSGSPLGFCIRLTLAAGKAISLKSIGGKSAIAFCLGGSGMSGLGNDAAATYRDSLSKGGIVVPPPGCYGRISASASGPMELLVYHPSHDISQLANFAS